MPHFSDHKAERSHGVRYTCVCGWKSSTWYGKGAQRSAAIEFQAHKADEVRKAEALQAHADTPLRGAA